MSSGSKSAAIRGKYRLALWLVPLLLCGCNGTVSPPTPAKEPEPVPTIREAISAANEFADVLQRVQDAASARAAATDIQSKGMRVSEFQLRLQSLAVTHKDTKISQALADELKRDLTRAVERMNTEISRIQRLRMTAPADWGNVPRVSSTAGAVHLEATAAPKPSGDTAPPPTSSVNASAGSTAGRLPAMDPAGMPSAAARTPHGTAGIAPRASTSGVDAAPLDPNDPQYYEKLADRMLASNLIVRRDAIEVLLQTEPDEVKSAETRKQIARNFKQLALERRGNFDRGRAVEGLVRWGGKFSVPVLLELLDEPRSFVQDDVYKALGDLKDERAVGPVAARLNNFFDRERAARCLKRMGPVAEDAVLTIASVRDPKTILAITELLGEIGTKKSLAFLRSVAAQNRNPDVRAAAKLSIKSIVDRQRAGQADVKSER